LRLVVCERNGSGTRFPHMRSGILARYATITNVVTTAPSTARLVQVPRRFFCGLGAQ
jgi:hypothetical protein